LFGFNGGADYSPDMSDDVELLHRYAAEGAEGAFRELVQRRFGLVYAVALRQVGGDEHLARDVAQRVFVELARRASTLSRRKVVSGWLYQTARFTAIDVVRAERRRSAREQEAQRMNELSTEVPSDTDWKKLRPVLDKALSSINERDRDAVMARVCEERSFSEIGRAFGLSEDAARMRVDRALEKLRRHLSRQGVTSTTAGLTLALANQAIVTVPAGLATSITDAALVGATSGGGLAAGLAFMSMTKFQAGLIGALVLSSAVGFVWQHHTRAQLRDELAALRLQSREASRLREENRRLASAAVAAPADPGELSHWQHETASLRQRVAEAKNAAAQETALPAGMVAIAALSNAGFATPGAAFESLIWAKERVDLNVLDQALVLEPEGQAKLAAAFEKMSESVRATLPDVTTPEQLVALSFGLSEPLVGVQVVGARPVGADEVVLSTRQAMEIGRAKTIELRFRRTTDGWRWVVPSNVVTGLLERSGRSIPLR
jgi:RNA polymerase sigma factor (sigma-70 family)